MGPLSRSPPPKEEEKERKKRKKKEGPLLPQQMNKNKRKKKYLFLSIVEPVSVFRRSSREVSIFINHEILVFSLIGELHWRGRFFGILA
jgi:hypothetical protein